MDNNPLNDDDGDNEDDDELSLFSGASGASGASNDSKYSTKSRSKSLAERLSDTLSAIDIDNALNPSRLISEDISHTSEGKKPKKGYLSSIAEERVTGDVQLVDKHQIEDENKAAEIAVTNIRIENVLLICGIALAAYTGAYIRLAIDYYKIWKTEMNYVSH